MSFQGEPGVRGPPGHPGPRGIGNQGPKVSPQVCALCKDQVQPATSKRTLTSRCSFDVTYFFLITDEKFSFLLFGELSVNGTFKSIKTFSSPKEMRKLVSPKKVVAQGSKYF